MSWKNASAGVRVKSNILFVHKASHKKIVCICIRHRGLLVCWNKLHRLTSNNCLVMVSTGTLYDNIFYLVRHSPFSIFLSKQPSWFKIPQHFWPTWFIVCKCEYERNIFHWTLKKDHHMFLVGYLSLYPSKERFQTILV